MQRFSTRDHESNSGRVSREVRMRSDPPAGDEKPRAESEPTGTGSFSGRRSSRLWRWFRWMCLITVVAELLYVVCANAYLNSSGFQKKFNQRPDHFAIRWKAARTWIPGWVELSEVRFVGQGVNDVYSASMTQCRFRVWIPDLLRKRIECTRFVAENLDFRLTKTSATVSSSTNAAEYAGYPDIAMLAEVPRRTDGKQKGRGFRWNVHVTDIHFPHIQTLWIHSMRLEGISSLHARMERAPDGMLWTEVQSYQLTKGNLFLHGRKAGREINLRLSGGIQPVPIDDVSDDVILDHVHARVESDGQLAALQLLQSRVGAQDEWIPEGTVHYRARVDIAKGTYLPGSEVHMDAPRLGFRIKNWHWSGRLQLQDRVQTIQGQPTALLRAQITELQWMEEGQEPVALHDAAVAIESEARNLRLVDRFSDATLKLFLNSVQLPNPRMLNRYLPEGVAGAFQTGALRCRAEFTRTGKRHFVGGLDLDGEELGVRMKEEDYVLDMRMRARFESDPKQAQRLWLNNTSLLLTNIQSPAMTRRQSETWFALAELEAGNVVSEPAWRMESPLRVWLRDTRPIAAVLRAEKDAPGWLGWIPTLHEVRGRCVVVASTNLLEFRDVAVRGNYTEVLAELIQRGEQLRGILYVRWGPLSIGFDLREEERHWSILAAKRWYERVRLTWRVPGLPKEESPPSPP